MAESVSTGKSQALVAEDAGLLARSGKVRRQNTLWGDAWRRLRRNKLALAGLVVVVILCFIAIFAPVLAREPLDVQNYNALYAHPSSAHPMGADQLGRDILSRVIWGSRVSLLVGLGAQVIVLTIGVTFGALAGFFGGLVDQVLMRIVDVVYAFPTLLFVILLISLTGRGLIQIFLVIGITSWVTLARLVRAQFLTLRERDYVVAARSIGATDWRLILRHMLPNALTPIIVALTFGIPAAIFTEAFLSFIGAGISPPQTSWGYMVGENQSYLRSYPWMLIWPSIALGLTMLAFTFLGDGLRDALDPNAKKD
jgi:ABC-type dipeptide/oligopeptide/nickel transport system permease subunit